MAFIKSKIKTLAMFSIVFITMAGIGVFLGGHLENLFFESVESKNLKGKSINILFMGIDARDAKTNSRSDTMIVASIDTNSKKMALVSIPRDTRIKNSAGKYDKINSVNFINGPEAACKQVANLLNIPVSYYVITNFAGFGEIVDALGGVHIYVPPGMKHTDPINPELAFNIPAGNQYLNGKQALGFVRYRGGPTADIGRTENQQKFIKALAEEVLQSKTILKLPELIPQINKNVRTNLPIKDLAYLGNMAKDIDLANLSTQTLPGYFLHDSNTGVSYWEADKKVASILIESLLKGETFKVVMETPASLIPKKSVVSAAQSQDNPKSSSGEAGFTETGSETDEPDNSVNRDDDKSSASANESKKDADSGQTLNPKLPENESVPETSAPTKSYDQNQDKTKPGTDLESETKPINKKPQPLVLN
ncbi:MAG: LCP family protein [Syntrophomonas sp.]|nr:LCP family protein [Syntrophomonas sp.]